MPGKKGKGKGKGKKKGSAKKKKTDSAKKKPDFDGPVDEGTRQVFVNQMKDLEERIARYKDRADSTEIRNKDLEDRLKVEQRDKFDVTITLKRQLGAYHDLNADLQRNITDMRTQHEMKKDEYEQQIAALKTEIKNQRDTLEGEIRRLKADLRSLEEFREMREELEIKTRRLEEELKETKAEYNQYKKDMERHMVVKQQRLKEEMMDKLEATAAEFHKLSNQRMSESTKRTMKENSAVNERLQTMAQDAAAEMEKRQKLSDRCSKLRQELDILQETHRIVLEEKVSNSRVMQLLVLKMKEQEDAVQKVSAMEQSMDKLGTALQESEEQRAIAEGMCARYASQLEELDETLEEAQDKHRSLEAEHEKVCNVLSGLGELLIERVEGPSDLSESKHPAGEGSDVVTTMMSVVGVAVDQGLIKLDRGRPNVTAMAPAAKTHAKNGVLPPLATKGRITLTSKPELYTPGAMGLGPSLAPPQPLAKPKQLMKGTEGRKVFDVAVQTISVPKSLLLADRLMGDQGPDGQIMVGDVPQTASRAALTEEDYYLQQEIIHHDQVLVNSIKKSAKVAL